MSERAARVQRGRGLGPIAWPDATSAKRRPRRVDDVGDGLRGALGGELDVPLVLAREVALAPSAARHLLGEQERDRLSKSRAGVVGGTGGDQALDPEPRAVGESTPPSSRTSAPVGLLYGEQKLRALDSPGDLRSPTLRISPSELRQRRSDAELHSTYG